MAKNSILQSTKRRALLKRVRKVIDLEVLLTILGIDYDDRGNELYACCPHPEHIDDDPSWSINNKEGNERHGLHSCWSCGFAGDFIQLTAIIMSTDDDNWSYEDAANWILEKVMKGEALDDDAFYDMALESKLEAEEDDDDDEPLEELSLPKEFRRLVTKNDFYEYAISRGITPIQIVKYGIGFALRGRYQNRLIIPFKLNGKIVSFFARSILSSTPKKYRGYYPKGPKMHKLIWSYDELDSSLGYIIGVEGPIDRLRLKALGFKNVICWFGAKVSDYQVTMLDELFKEYVSKTGKVPIVNLVPDADGEIIQKGNNVLYTKGKLMIKHAEEKLSHKYKVYVIDLPQGSDPGDAANDKIIEAFENKHTLHSQGKVTIEEDYTIRK